MHGHRLFQNIPNHIEIYKRSKAGYLLAENQNSYGAIVDKYPSLLLSLPSEILLIIFSYLPYSPDLKNLRLVNKALNRFVDSPHDAILHDGILASEIASEFHDNELKLRENARVCKNIDVRFILGAVTGSMTLSVCVLLAIGQFSENRGLTSGIILGSGAAGAFLSLVGQECRQRFCLFPAFLQDVKNNMIDPLKEPRIERLKKARLNAVAIEEEIKQEAEEIINPHEVGQEEQEEERNQSLLSI